MVLPVKIRLLGRVSLEADHDSPYLGLSGVHLDLFNHVDGIGTCVMYKEPAPITL